jgi:hypothetical protein
MTGNVMTIGNLFVKRMPAFLHKGDDIYRLNVTDSFNPKGKVGRTEDLLVC